MAWFSKTDKGGTHYHNGRDPKKQQDNDALLAEQAANDRRIKAQQDADNARRAEIVRKFKTGK